jgi:hypothetical protein
VVALTTVKATMVLHQIFRAVTAEEAVISLLKNESRAYWHVHNRVAGGL